MDNLNKMRVNCVAMTDQLEQSLVDRYWDILNIYETGRENLNTGKQLNADEVFILDAFAAYASGRLLELALKKKLNNE